MRKSDYIVGVLILAAIIVVGDDFRAIALAAAFIAAAWVIQKVGMKHDKASHPPKKAETHNDWLADS